MPRYMIVRASRSARTRCPLVGRRSREILETEVPGITWEHSHVVVDDEGLVRTFCVYAAPNEDIVREHDAARAAHDRGDRRDRRRRHAGGLPARLTSARWNDAELRDREPAPQHVPALGVVGRHEVERLAVEQHRVLLRPAALGLLGRRDEVVDRPLEVAGVAPVAGERAVASPTSPVGSSMNSAIGAWPARAAGARQQVVGDVADEHVLERRTAASPSMIDDALAADQVAPLERRRAAAEPVGDRASITLERAAPEHLADDRRVEEERALLGRQRVEARGDDAADVVGSLPGATSRRCWRRAAR